jgi:hypothetical protein
MNLNLPGGSPDLIRAVGRLLRQVLSFPLRLWRVATADLPTASTDNEGGIAYDETVSRITWSDGSAWLTAMPYTAGEALTRTNDTNVTLTLGGTPATALLKATSLTLGWTGTLAVARGGTGVTALGDITRVSDTNVTLTLGGTPTGAVVNATSFTLGWTGTLAVARGGTGGGSASGTLLDNITAFASTGHLVRTGAGAYAFRTITGTANEITVTNGDGVSANPTLSLPAALTFTGKNITGGGYASVTSFSMSTTTGAQITLTADNAGTPKAGVMGLDSSGNFIIRNTTAGGHFFDTFNGTVTIRNAGSGFATVATINTTGIDIPGEVRGNSFRIDQAPVAATPVPTHTFTISLNGTTYRIPCVV